MKTKSVLAIAAAFLLCILLIITRDEGPPSRDDVEYLLARRSQHFRHDLLAYEVVDDAPYVLYHVPMERNSILFLKLLEQSWMDTWRLASGTVGSIDYTTAPASLAVARCPAGHDVACHDGTMIFGQVNDRNIVALQVEQGGKQQPYSVAGPAFIIRLDRLSGILADYRWLDASGRVVWTKQQSESSTPVTIPHRDDSVAVRAQ